MIKSGPLLDPETSAAVPPGPQHRELPVQLPAHPVRCCLARQKAPQDGEAALNEGTRKACLGLLGFWGKMVLKWWWKSTIHGENMWKWWKWWWKSTFFWWRKLKRFRKSVEKLLKYLEISWWLKGFEANTWFNRPILTNFWDRWEVPSQVFFRFTATLLNVAKQIFRKRVHTSASRDELHLQERGSKILVAELDSQLTWGNIRSPSDDFLIVPICGTMSHPVTRVLMVRTCLSIRHVNPMDSRSFFPTPREHI